MLFLNLGERQRSRAGFDQRCFFHDIDTLARAHFHVGVDIQHARCFIHYKQLAGQRVCHFHVARAGQMQRPRRAGRRRRIHHKRLVGSAAIREFQNAGAVNCRVQLVPGLETCDLQGSVHGQRRIRSAEIRAFPNERSRGNRQRLSVARAE